ncbi:MAG: outer membrane protein assembly factor BamB family protein [Streptosporangiaceae bacterium]
MLWIERILTGTSIVAATGLLIPAATSVAATSLQTGTSPQPRTLPRASTLPHASASPQAKARTTTTLTVTRKTLTRDSWVTFTAKVTSPSGVPGSYVTFDDQSNGSILDSARVRKGKATFRTAALAPGSRHIVAHFLGGTKFAASTSGVVRVTVSQAGSPATAYQVDAKHDGDQTSSALHANGLAKKWSRTLGGSSTALVSYPVIAGGRVFVTVENAASYGTKLYALNASTGATEWSVGLGGTYGFSALAYDGQRLIALNGDGVLTEFVASTGRQIWSGQLPKQWSFTAPPTAYDGDVYVSGAGSGGTVYAISEADSRIRWEFSVENGDKSSPAVDDSGVYVSYACQQDYRFALSGRSGLHRNSNCEGGGGSTAVLHGSALYARGADDSPLVLVKTTLKSVGSFASKTAPAFGGTNLYSLQDGNLVASAQSGSPDHWTFGDGTLVTAPVVSGGIVFEGSSNGTVYGVAASSGNKVWSGQAGSEILGPDEQNAFVLVGMAVGGGLLVVPAGNALTAFGD